ncbi:flagellar motor protein MotB [uncultured Sphingomonas sp.]|uniref:flagellar motor protein MotB n=1 Tax=uncultured Sphingomonas sp. TaxID=158754 RepID=UPI0035CC3CD2
MPAARAPHGANVPPKVIVKKIFIEGHGGHHGGAWKVAYADFVTAMMAFFLLLWLLGATTEKQRKGIADYFAPTLVDTRHVGVGGSGLLGGDSLVDADNLPHRAAQTGTRVLTVPVGATGGASVGSGPDGTLRSREAMAQEDKKNFETLRRRVLAGMAATKDLAKLGKHVHFTMTRDGMRIDLIDDADYSMFALGTTALEPEAGELIGLVAGSVKAMANPIMIRGHTDNLGYGNPAAMNNWMLSSARAEATRRRLAAGGLPDTRFDRIEGVADREPMIVKDPADPRNRRVSITLLYRAGSFTQ